MKNLILLIIFSFSLSLSAQQDAMFSKYMFYSHSKVPDSPGTNTDPNNLDQMEFLQQQLKLDKRIDISKKNIKSADFRLYFQLRKKNFYAAEKDRTAEKDASVMSSKDQTSSKNIKRKKAKADRVEVQLEYLSQHSFNSKTKKYVAIINLKGKILGSARIYFDNEIRKNKNVISRVATITGLSITSMDSGKIQAILFDLPDEDIGGFKYVLLPPITHGPLEELENQDPGRMILP